MELRVATTANDIGQASLIKGLLESAGIETALSGGVGDVFPDTATIGAIDILVREEDLAAACEVLAQIEDNDVDFDEEE